MQQAFLVIVLFLGAAYAIFTKQVKIALALVVLGIAFFLDIPSISSGGIVQDILGALSMILFALGVFALVFKKKPKQESSKEPQNENTEKE